MNETGDVGDACEHRADAEGFIHNRANPLSFVLDMQVACRNEERPGQMEAIEGWILLPFKSLKKISLLNKGPIFYERGRKN